MKAKLVVFDLAGTTVRDTNTVGGALQAALAEIGVVASVAEVNAVMGIPKPVAIAHILSAHGTAGDVDAIHARFQSLMIEIYRTDPGIDEIDGATEVMEKLKNAGLKIAVDTGFDRAITDVVISRMPWRDLIDDSIASDEVADGRPAPDMLFALAERQRITPAEIVKVGDTPSDILQGRAAGAGLVVGVLYGTHTREQLAPHGPDALIEHLSELPGLILEHKARS
jgi:phosphonatase-like hydrolase